MTSQKQKITCKHRHNRRRRRGGSGGKTALAPGDYLTSEQVQKILSCLRLRAESGTMRSAVNLMIVEVFLYTGLRATELCGLQLRDLPRYHGKQSIYVAAEFAKGRKQPVQDRGVQSECVSSAALV